MMPKAEAAKRRSGRLIVRVVSGTAMVLVVLILVSLGRPGLLALAVLVGGLSLWEFRGLSSRMGYRAPSWLIFPLGAYFIFSETLPRWLDLRLVLALALVIGLAIFLFIGGDRSGLGRWAMGLAGAVYIGMPLNFYLLLGNSSGHGVLLVLLIIVSVAISDSSALLVGSWLGRHPFFASISPRKTLEGAIAGVIFPVVPALIVIVGVLGLPAYHAVALGLLIGFSAEVGDLVESQMKRIANVKDSSQLIPGHGGILDRIDSVLFPPILVYLYLAGWHLL